MKCIEPAQLQKLLFRFLKTVKAQFLFDIEVVIEFSIDQVINWDQTGIHYVPVDSWMMEEK